MLFYHLKKLHESADHDLPAAEISFSLLDNCVGQNKPKAALIKVVICFLLPDHSHNVADRGIAWNSRSKSLQINVSFEGSEQNFAMLSIVFPYRKVVICFLLPGHSHNVADRGIAWNSKSKSLQINVSFEGSEQSLGVFFDHNDPKWPFYVGWKAVLSNYFLPPPAGYTANYLFEIDQGIQSGKNVVTELFGHDVTNIYQASTSTVRLSRHPINELPEKKLKSLSTKYCSIPPQYLGYYPSIHLIQVTKRKTSEIKINVDRVGHEKNTPKGAASNHQYWSSSAQLQKEAKNYQALVR
ncbi:hypothetical protein PHMEG_00030320 [Phytophthora megakarya]|uniref:Uncharacterized protein n=1 Tax=Phytophthora megakarya TaxID=4795 RepID=A0A225V240_9STRA|nr:hypothetical protein PHMEG_00030320 [Phytophthora megakarya]